MRTNVIPCCAVGDAVEQTHQAASVADGLLVPDDFFFWPTAVVLCAVFVLFDAELLVGLVDGKDEQQGVCGPRHEREQLGLVDAEDIVEFEFLLEAELVREGAHDLGVVLWPKSQQRRPGWGAMR